MRIIALSLSILALSAPTLFLVDGVMVRGAGNVFDARKARLVFLVGLAHTISMQSP